MSACARIDHPAVIHLGDGSGRPARAARGIRVLTSGMRSFLSAFLRLAAPIAFACSCTTSPKQDTQPPAVPTLSTAAPVSSDAASAPAASTSAQDSLSPDL